MKNRKDPIKLLLCFMTSLRVMKLSSPVTFVVRDSKAGRSIVQPIVQPVLVPELSPEWKVKDNLVTKGPRITLPGFSPKKTHVIHRLVTKQKSIKKTRVKQNMTLKCF